MCSHLNDAAQELTGTLGRSFVSECRMAAVSNTVQSTEQWSTRANLAPAENMPETGNKGLVPEQILCIGALESHSVLSEVSGKTTLQVNNRIF